jgi:hypothetical protein
MKNNAKKRNFSAFRLKCRKSAALLADLPA